MDANLPQFVEKYNERNYGNLVSDDSPVSSTEICLKNWFKCTKFNSCYATTHDRNAFALHLRDRHDNEELFCIYCNRISDQMKTMYSPEALINHLIETHRYRRFQCNLCLFRAMSADHVNIHQSLIHPSLHSASLINKQIDGKICKILHCPPIDTNNDSNLPNLYDYYERYHKNRKNNDEKHDNMFQCLYCEFMREDKREVIDHCAQEHADYPIMFYNPEPEITSTQSPSSKSSPKWLSDIDSFPGKQETQENRVSSTGLHEPIELDSDSSDNGNVANNDGNNSSNKKTDSDNDYGNRVSKKQRISRVPNRDLAHSPLLSERFTSNPLPKCRSSSQSAALRIKNKAYICADKLSLIKIEQRNDKRGPNSIIRKNLKPRSRPLISVSPPLVEFVEKSASNSSKVECEKKFVCLLCKGNHGLMKESTIISHLHLYHNTCKVKPPNRPFCCCHCRQFCGTEAEVKCHAILCDKKTNQNSNNAFVFIVPKDQHQTADQSSDQYEDRTQTSNSNGGQKANNSDESFRNSLNQMIETSDEEMNHEFETENSHKIRQEKNDVNARRLSNNSIIDEHNMWTDKKCAKQLKTTIELSVSDDDIETKPKFNYICLFCDITSANSDSAISHLKTHFPNIEDDYKVTKPVHKWIRNFVHKQNCLFEEANDSVNFDDCNDSGGHNRYQCPICVKIANLNNLKAKQFKNFWELRVHYWEHSFWLPVKCNICKPNYDLPNCDHVIVQHLNSKHHDKLVNSDNQLIKTLIGDKMKNQCSYEQRSALEKNLITHSPYEVLDSHIENTLKIISEKQDSKLRLIHNCHRRALQIQVKRLPKINFDDQNVVRKYLKQVSRQNNSYQVSKGFTSNKIREQIELGSSSDESQDRIPVIVRRKKPKSTYRKLFDDESDEKSNNNRNEVYNNSDDDQTSDIEILNNDLNDCYTHTTEELGSKLNKQLNDKECTKKPKISEKSETQNKVSENAASSKPTHTSEDLSETQNKCINENEVQVNEESETVAHNQSVSISYSQNEPCTSSIASSSASPKSPNERSASTKKMVCVCSECNKYLANKNQIREHYTEQHPGSTIRFTRKTI